MKNERPMNQAREIEFKPIMAAPHKTVGLARFPEARIIYKINTSRIGTEKKKGAHDSAQHVPAKNVTGKNYSRKDHHIFDPLTRTHTQDEIFYLAGHG